MLSGAPSGQVLYCPSQPTHDFLDCETLHLLIPGHTRTRMSGCRVGRVSSRLRHTHTHTHIYKGFPPLRTPTEKTCKITEHMSRDSSLHLVPGRYKPPTAPGGSLRKDSPGWEKAENKFTATSGLPACVCVCPVSPPYMHVCVPVCRVCH